MAIHLADYIDILGTFSFAVSGAFAAKEKRLDLFGVFILAFVTAIGGGTIRDMLIGDLPVSWMHDPEIGWVIAAGAAGSLFFGSRLQQMQRINIRYRSEKLSSTAHLMRSGQPMAKPLTQDFDRGGSICFSQSC